MPKNYYTASTVDKFPFQANEILRRVILYISNELLYKEENYQTEAQATERFVLTSATVEMAGRENIDKWKNTNWKFPFTVYVPGEVSKDETRLNKLAQSSLVYSEAIGSFVSSRPMKMEILFVSFFNTPSDYFLARKKLVRPTYNLVRLEVPIVMNGTTSTFPIDIAIEVTKGDYPYEFKEWLTYGRIFDIVHNITISYYDYTFNEWGKDFYPVDDMVLELASYKEQKDFYGLFSSGVVPDPLSVSGVIPIDEQTGVDVNSGIIVRFNVPVQEETAISAFSTNPAIMQDITFDCSGLVMTATPTYPMTSGTVYNCTIDYTVLKDVWGGNLKQNYYWVFTTA